MDYPLEKLFACCFLFIYWVLIRHHIFWEMKRKGEHDFEKKHLRQQLDTIEDPHNKHTIEDQGCSWTAPLKNCLSAVFNWVLIRHPI